MVNKVRKQNSVTNISKPINGTRNKLISAFNISLLAASVSVAAQQSNTDSVDEIEVIQVISTGSRLPTDLTTIPGSVTVIDQESIEAQTAISSDLGRTISFATPGMAPSSNDGNNYSQTLRGRKPAFFIDGIPQSAALRGGGRDLRILHPSVLERVEIINGATSIYGLGGSGGVVNYITKSPEQDSLKFYTEVGLGSSISEFGDGTELTVTQSILGATEAVSYVFNANYQTRGLYYDADGDPIPPDPYGQTGLADMDELSLYGKVSIDLSDDITLGVMAMNYDAKVDTNYTVGQGSYAAGVKSIAVEATPNNIQIGPIAFDYIGDVDPYSENFFTYLTLTHDNLWESEVSIDLYYKDSELVWRALPYIIYLPTAAGFPPDGSQLQTNNKKSGLNLDVVTPLTFGDAKGVLLWGFDYSKDETGEQLTDGRVRTSTLTQTGYASFGQLQLAVNDWLNLRGGLRYDKFDLDIPTFKALDFFSTDVLHTIVGTELDYSSLTGNIGLVADINDTISVFGSWSTGFSIGNVIRSISNQRPLTPGPALTYDVSALGDSIKAVEVESYEAGVRFDNGTITASVTAFYNESDLGASFDSVTLELIRAPERVWGVEIVANAYITDWMRAGINLSSMKSKLDSAGDGSFSDELNFTRVPPPLAKYYLETDYENWTARLQATTVLSDSRFSQPYSLFERDIKSYTIVDLFVSRQLDNGQISIGVENLLNKQYTPMATELACPSAEGIGVFYDATCNVAGVGARGMIKYSIHY